MSIQNVRLRPLAGMINRADEVMVPVYLSSKHVEGANEEEASPDECFWVSITKSAARDLLEEAKERGVEEIEGVEEEDGCLYLHGPGDDGAEEAPAGEE
jgi:hypothetical protein